MWLKSLRCLFSLPNDLHFISLNSVMQMYSTDVKWVALSRSLKVVFAILESKNDILRCRVYFLRSFTVATFSSYLVRCRRHFEFAYRTDKFSFNSKKHFQPFLWRFVWNYLLTEKQNYLTTRFWILKLSFPH